MRRKEGTLTPIEYSILDAATRFQQQGVVEFYGFQLAKEIRDGEGARRLVGLGTLYRALESLVKQGFLDRRWEQPLSVEQNRPRRRYYRLTGEEVKGVSH